MREGGEVARLLTGSVPVLRMECWSELYDGFLVNDSAFFILDLSVIERMRAQFARIGVQGGEFASDFYARLFHRAPKLRSLFPLDMAAQGHKLMITLGLLVGSLDNPERLAAPLAHLGRKHAGYGAKPEHFAVVGQALLETLAEWLGEDFDGATRQGWTHAYQGAVGMMQAGMQVAAIG